MGVVLETDGERLDLEVSGNIKGECPWIMWSIAQWESCL